MSEHGCVHGLYVTDSRLHMAMGHSCLPPGEEEQTELCLSLTIDGNFLRGKGPVPCLPLDPERLVLGLDVAGAQSVFADLRWLLCQPL